MTMKPPPPGPATNGTVTPRALAVATAASTASPPRRSTSTPARLAPTSIDATAPPVPTATGRFGLRAGRRAADAPAGKAAQAAAHSTDRSAAIPRWPITPTSPSSQGQSSTFPRGADGKPGDPNLGRTIWESPEDLPPRGAPSVSGRRTRLGRSRSRRSWRPDTSWRSRRRRDVECPRRRSVVRVHGGGDPCECGVSNAASRGAPVAQDRPEIAAVTHELGPAVTDWS